MQHPPFKQTETAKATTQVTEEVQSNTEQQEQSMESLLQENNITWESLDEIRTSLNEDAIKFVHDFEEIVNSPLVHGGLGEDKPEFDRYINIFQNDIVQFNSTVMQIMAQHKGKTGKIVTDDEYAEFMGISMAYQSAYMNIATVVGPVMMQLVMLLTQIQAKSSNKIVYVGQSQPVDTLTDPSVVSDVVLKSGKEETQHV